MNITSLKCRFFLSLPMLISLFLVPAGCNDSEPSNGTEKNESNSVQQENSNPTTEQDSGKTASKDNPLNLPQKFQTMLRQEMIKIEGGMKQLLSHLVRGNGKLAARVSMNIHNSFILKQKLSRKELKRLQGLLPKPFVSQDRAFHKQAKQLAEAANKGEIGKAMSYYNDMTSGCVSCHQTYAKHRFPKFKENGK